jgi:hypothetical protein
VNQKKYDFKFSLLNNVPAYSNSKKERQLIIQPMNERKCKTFL